MGLVNAVVPLDHLEAEGVRWAREVLQHSPTAIRCSMAFNAETDGLAGLQELRATPPISFIEQRKPWRAVMSSEKRSPDFSETGWPRGHASVHAPSPLR